jgi:DNA-binding Lrp family transcriptional regulator
MIDDIDRRILKELQLDARTSFAELGRRVGLTTPAVIERVRKLEDAHIITGYRVDIDTAKVGLPITAFVRMSITGVDYSHIIEVAKSSNEVLECHRGRAPAGTDRQADALRNNNNDDRAVVARPEANFRFFEFLARTVPIRRRFCGKPGRVFL